MPVFLLQWDRRLEKCAAKLTSRRKLAWIGDPSLIPSDLGFRPFGNNGRPEKGGGSYVM
jgi:hypothetical protein